MNINYMKEKDYIEALKQMKCSEDTIKSILSNSAHILKVKYSDPEFPTLFISEKGNWIDLKCTKDYHFNAGESGFIDLGIAMKPPKGYEAHLAPRSGTFRKYGLMQTNGVGVIDDSYSGDDDIWQMPVYATTDTDVKRGERLCQFRLIPTMEAIFSGKNIAANWFASFGSPNALTILEVDKLDDVNRGGFGSTGL